jgi:hypothetical protein
METTLTWHGTYIVKRLGTSKHIYNLILLFLEGADEKGVMRKRYFDLNGMEYVFSEKGKKQYFYSVGGTKFYKVVSWVGMNDYIIERLFTILGQ